MSKTLYLISPKIKWKAFKIIQYKIIKDSGSTPKNGDKILWKMLRDKQIHCWFASDYKNDMGICLYGTLPQKYKKWQIKLIS